MARVLQAARTAQPRPANSTLLTDRWHELLVLEAAPKPLLTSQPTCIGRLGLLPLSRPFRTSTYPAFVSHLCGEASAFEVQTRVYYGE